MSRFPGPFGASQTQPLPYESSADSVTLAQFFNAVYAWMATGLALTAVVAWSVAANVNAMRAFLQPGVILVIFLVELVLVVSLSSAIQRINSVLATILFLVYSALNGIVLSFIFLAYTRSSIAGAFVVTAGSFGAMSLYGFVTKRDLTNFGSMLFMALIGLILASVVNIFWANDSLYWIITYAGVLIFVGLTAYDTQKLRYIGAATAHDKELSNRLAINGALVLYLDFINLFILLLRLMGKRR